MSTAKVRRARAYGITRSYGNIRNWEAAQWREQEARERAEAGVSATAVWCFKCGAYRVAACPHT